MSLQPHTGNLKDSFGRVHDYLRISMTDKCNLRCFYCMPENPLFMAKPHLLQEDEIQDIASLFVNEFGINKIRLTGGEPLLRKNVANILARLSGLPVSLAITTNGILLDQHFDTLRNAGINSINISLDSLLPDKFAKIARRDHFQVVMNHIHQALDLGFRVKVNAVVMRDLNEDEIPAFVEWTRNIPIHVRFIEFMPFDGNHWNWSKMVPFREILDRVQAAFPIEKLEDAPHSTSKSYRVPGFEGTFAIISSVTEPFCGSCNRLRLTADGKIRNCLFGTREWDILSPWRRGEDIRPIIREATTKKAWERGGLPEFAEENCLLKQLSGRSMVRIGG